MNVLVYAPNTLSKLLCAYRMFPLTYLLMDASDLPRKQPRDEMRCRYA